MEVHSTSVHELDLDFRELIRALEKEFSRHSATWLRKKESSAPLPFTSTIESMTRPDLGRSSNCVERQE